MLHVVWYEKDSGPRQNSMVRLGFSLGVVSYLLKGCRTSHLADSRLTRGAAFSGQDGIFKEKSSNL